MTTFNALALLEVMDKEPGILGFWISAIVLGGLGFSLARRRWWWAAPIIILIVIGFLGTWDEWTDPFVGPAIAREAGRSYPFHLIASTSLACAVIILGMIRPRRTTA
jgi:hypothetical protein